MSGKKGEDRCENCIKWQDKTDICWCNEQDILHKQPCQDKMAKILSVQNTRDEYEETWYCSSCGTVVLMNKADNEDPWIKAFYKKD